MLIICYYCPSGACTWCSRQMWKALRMWMFPLGETNVSFCVMQQQLLHATSIHHVPTHSLPGSAHTSDHKYLMRLVLSLCHAQRALCVHGWGICGSRSCAIYLLSNIFTKVTEDMNIFAKKKCDDLWNGSRDFPLASSFLQFWKVTIRFVCLS